MCVLGRAMNFFDPSLGGDRPPPPPVDPSLLNVQSPANYHSHIVFCHVLRKRTLHNVNHQHENIQILQLLLNTYIHHCVKRRSTTNDISECERHCLQNLPVATEGKKNLKYSYE